jgi:uncharacterized protein YjbI with pentapeptide repeats
VANPEHLARLKENVRVWNEWRTSNPDIEIDLSESDLSKCFLVGAYLSNANLNAANFSGALLQRAKLKRANLQNANFTEANLSNANLVLANLRGATFKRTNLQDSTLSQAILAEAKLSRADLQAADLSKADLTGARLYGTNLSRANLSGVDMTAALLQDTDLSGATLHESILNREVMHNCILTGANLSGINLSGQSIGDVNLKGADLRGADLQRTDLSGANLSAVNLSEANLHETILDNVDLSDAILVKAEMSRASLRHAKLDRANLSQVSMTAADLTAAHMHQANFAQANLHRVAFYSSQLIDCNLKGADLTCTNLQTANLNRSNLTGAFLWETLRAGWSIQEVICERAFWDRVGRSVTEYAPGEFERLYSDQTTIELFYEGGISSFELNTLPALLQHLASKHPDASIHLKTIEQTGGGAKITISLGDADDSLKAKIEADALHVVNAQLQLRDNDLLRLQIENTTLRQMHETAIRLMLTSSAPQITFNAPVHTAAIPSGNAKVELHQTFNDNTELIQLIDKLFACNTELTAAQSTEVEEAKAELQKREPQKSRLTSFYDFLKTLPKEAILKGVGKLGERAAEADWSNLLHQLSEFIHHL